MSAISLKAFNIAIDNNEPKKWMWKNKERWETQKCF